MIQLEIKKLPEKIRSCLFTGHRELKDDFSREKLEKAIDECVKRGCEEFYCGMAKGFDLLAGMEIVKRIKAGKNLKLFACIPYKKQSGSYVDQDKKDYEEILKYAEKTVCLFEEYTPWCMMKRNEYMADRSDVAIAYLNQDKGGTFNTVKYFSKKKQGYVFYV